jgi:hypothetical protein
VKYRLYALDFVRKVYIIDRYVLLTGRAKPLRGSPDGTRGSDSSSGLADMIFQDQAVGVLDCAVSGYTKACQPTCAVQDSSRLNCHARRGVPSRVTRESIHLGKVMDLLRNVVRGRLWER